MKPPTAASIRRRVAVLVVLQLGMFLACVYMFRETNKLHQNFIDWFNPETTAVPLEARKFLSNNNIPALVEGTRFMCGVLAFVSCMCFMVYAGLLMTTGIFGMDTLRTVANTQISRIDALATRWLAGRTPVKNA
jgi:hypothetical protein